MNSNLISKAVRYALVAGAATALTAPAVFAQDTGQSNSSSSSNQNQNNTAQLGKIEVTGTRIKRTDVETAQPVTIVTAAQIKATGLTTVGDILQNLTQAGDGLNTLFNNGGSGATYLDLRYLGSNRLLVLVNGRRWIPGLAGSVDVNTIPASVIDHIEILQDGASAIYGSDAIAGVVNFITIKNYNGAEANAYLGIFNGDSHWDGKQQEYDFTVGSSGDRSGIVMNISYTNQDGVFAGNRTISKEAIWTQGGGSSANANGRFILAGPVLGGQMIGKGQCNPYTGTTSQYGTCDLTLQSPVSGKPPVSDLRNYSPADAYNYAPQNYLITPNERTSAYVQGHYDIADNLTFSTEVLYNQRNSNQTLASSPIFLGLGEYTANGKGIDIGAGNPYNPFGVDLVSNTSEWCVVQGNCNTNPNELLLLLGRRPIEGGNRVFTQNISTYQFNGGFQGYFNMLDSEWDWDLGYNYGTVNEFDSTNGLFDTGRLEQALSSNCPSDPTCVPLNLFGGLGSITQNMLQYTQYQEHNTSQLNMRDYTGNITGDIGDWFGAGQTGLALGSEYLENDGYFHPDATTSSGNTTGNTTQPTDGKVKTQAEYIEFNIPILSDMPFAKSLSLDLANRWSSFKWAGGQPGSSASLVEHDAHASTGRWALKYQVVDSLLLRASWSQGFRTPSISDLYFGQSSNYPAASDPCAGGKYGGWNGNLADLPPGCNGTPHKNQVNAQIVTVAGGNPDLSPEKAISRTAGFVYNPNWLPGWDFSADYYNIVLTNEIGTLTAQQLLNGCYKSQNANFCNHITVQANTITGISAVSQNLGITRTSGVDLSTHYKLPSTAIGDFKVGLDWTFLRNFTNTFPTGSGFQTTEEAGFSTAFGGVPKQKATLSVDWNYGDWSANWNLKYIHSLYEDCSPTTISDNECSNPTMVNPNDGNVGMNHLGAWITHNAQVGYHLDSWNTDFTFGVRNIFDKDPPAELTAFANSYGPALYNIMPGRFYYASVGVKF